MSFWGSSFSAPGGASPDVSLAERGVPEHPTTVSLTKEGAFAFSGNMQLNPSLSNKCAAIPLTTDVTLHAELVKSLPHRQAADVKCGSQSRLRWNLITCGKLTMLNAIQNEVLDLPI
jgi:hypothetical protein